MESETLNYLFEENNSEKEFEWCLVGNIINKHYFGENKEIKYGSKQFRSGAKVYILPTFGGMGHESISVIGLPRNKKKMIEIIIRSKMLKNVRVKKVYKKYLKDKIKNNLYYQNWVKSIDEVLKIKEFANFLNSMSKEI